MADLDVRSNVVLASEHHDPLKIKEEDYEEVRKLQVVIDALNKYRQEIGRLFQALNNLRQKTDEVEDESSKIRKYLVEKYNLEAIGVGQWAVDFEKKEFVRLSDKSPVIP